jgi:hypothetical protein
MIYTFGGYDAYDKA